MRPRPINRPPNRAPMSRFSARSLRGLIQALDQLVRGVPPPPEPEDVESALTVLRNATPEQLAEGQARARSIVELERRRLSGQDDTPTPPELEH